jgi:hypothetical protein
MRLSEWYPLLKSHTAETILIPMHLPATKRNQLIQETLDKWQCVFVRLDELSPKYFRSCTSIAEVWDCLKTPRTKELIHYTKYLCLRRWVDFSDKLELRCFVMSGKLTAICSNDAQEDSKPCTSFLLPPSSNDPSTIKSKTIEFLAPLIPLLVKDCTIDIAVDQSLKFQIIEVDSSVDEFAGSGLFDLDNPADLYQLHRGSEHVRFRYFVDEFFNIEEC